MTGRRTVGMRGIIVLIALLALTWFLVPTSFFSLAALYLLIALVVLLRRLWRKNR